MVIDMRQLNLVTKKTGLDLPKLADLLTYVEGSSRYGTFDVMSGFDYLATSPCSQQYFNIKTPFGTYTLLGAPQGFLNTPGVYQDRIVSEILQPANLYRERGEGAIQWLDDTLLFAKDTDKYLSALDRFLKGVINKGVRLSAEKCVILSERVEYCGRVIDEKGYNFNSKYYNKILEIQKPTYRHELASCYYISNWLSAAVPALAQLRDAFSEEVALNGRTLKQLTKDNELVNWTEDLEKSWERFKTLLSVAAKEGLANYSPDKELIVLMDASYHYWSLVVLQTDIGDVNEDITKMKNLRPLMYMSGKFTATETRWHICQKELFPLISLFKKHNFLVTGHPRPVRVYTDHKNLVPILRPKWTGKVNHLDRLRRWALLLQGADLLITHVKGEDNTFADMLSRWANTDPQGEDEKLILPRYASAVEVLRSMKEEDVAAIAYELRAMHKVPVDPSQEIPAVIRERFREQEIADDLDLQAQEEI